MRLFALLLVVAAIVVAAKSFWSGRGAARQTTAREILADPERFEGALVTFSVAAFENGPDEKTLTYRRLANRPPLLVVEFSVPYPDRRPAAVVGRVKSGNPVRITDSRPVP